MRGIVPDQLGQAARVTGVVREFQVHNCARAEARADSVPAPPDTLPSLPAPRCRRGVIVRVRRRIVFAPLLLLAPLRMSVGQRSVVVLVFVVVAAMLELAEGAL